jgi:DNA-binding transcriptional ArsR family regulator
MRKKIPELHYRSSRICRVLGNPTAYELLKVLAENEMRPTRIASEFGLSVQTICDALRSLRQLDLVRYETRRDGKYYFIKDTAILSAMREVERLVRRIRTREY